MFDTCLKVESWFTSGPLLMGTLISVFADDQYLLTFKPRKSDEGCRQQSDFGRESSPVVQGLFRWRSDVVDTL